MGGKGREEGGWCECGLQREGRGMRLLSVEGWTRRGRGCGGGEKGWRALVQVDVRVRTYVGEACSLCLPADPRTGKTPSPPQVQGHGIITTRYKESGAPSCSVCVARDRPSQ